MKARVVSRAFCLILAGGLTVLLCSLGVSLAQQAGPVTLGRTPQAPFEGGRSGGAAPDGSFPEQAVTFPQGSPTQRTVTDIPVAPPAPRQLDLSKLSQRQCVGAIHVQLSPPPQIPLSRALQAGELGTPVGQTSRSQALAGLPSTRGQPPSPVLVTPPEQEPVSPIEASYHQLQQIFRSGAEENGEVGASGSQPGQLSKMIGRRSETKSQPQTGAPGVVPLRQFGYTLFASPVSTFAPVDDIPVGPDYVLGPGDDLKVDVWGPVESTLVRTVDRNGTIFLPKVGALRVWGMSFTQADRLIREQLSRYFRGFQTTVTLGRLRTIRLYVVGEVCQPGTYTLSSLSTLTNALFAAGGPTKLGSLRGIRLLRNGHVVGTVDLYDFLLRGDRTRDFRLESGDTIFVPPIGPVVGIEGEVKRPAIYEMKKGTRLSHLMAMAGGLTPRSYLKRVQVIRSELNAERRAIDLDMTKFYIRGDAESDLGIQDGDLVRIFPTDPRIYNTVTLGGAVKYPGEYELKDGMRISQLLPPAMVLPEAHLDRLEVVRRRPDLSTEVIPVDLREVWKGEESLDLELKPLDQITVRTELRSVRTVTLTGEVKRPGEYSIQQGERLSSVLRRAGGYTERAYLKGAVFTRASLREIEQEQLNAFVRAQEERLLATAGETVIGIGQGEASQRTATIEARRELLRALASRVAVGRVVIHLDDPDRLDGTPDDIVLDDGDTLMVPQRPSSVLVLGAVRNPTSVRFLEGVDVGYYLNRVGGLTKQADKKEIHIVKADGSAVSDFVKLRTLEPGDTIVVPPKEEEKVRFLPVVKDVASILGSSLLAIAALAAL